MSYVFYDIETTGMNAAFDQIVQFAAIRTDDDLKETDRFEIRSRLLPYLIPSPGAMRVTGLTIEDLLRADHPSHYEMMCQVRDVLAGWCPAAFIGYNSLRFDEEFLRQAFYQCLHPPYLTNTGGSGRTDALTLVRTAYFLHPNCISVPLNDKGRPVFKLDRLAPANGFDHSNAHDALADVEATLFMCRLVAERCPDVWQQASRFATKQAVSDFVSGTPAFVLVEDARATAYAVTALKPAHDTGNTTYCWDLTVDPRPLMDLSQEALAKELRKSRSPVRKLKNNAAPSLCPLEHAPPHLFGELDQGTLERRGAWIPRQRAFVGRVVEAMEMGAVSYPPSPHVERQIYDGFWSREDGRKLLDFHAAHWEDRPAIADKISDQRLAWLARRLIWVERPDLCGDHAGMLAKEKAARLLADKDACGGWNTLSKAAAELEDVIDSLDDEAAAPFARLRKYLTKRQLECENVLSA